MSYYITISGNNCQVSKSPNKPIEHGSAQQTLEKIHRVMGDNKIQRDERASIPELRNQAGYIHGRYQAKITDKVQRWEKSYGRIITFFLKVVSGLNSESKKVQKTFDKICALSTKLDLPSASPSLPPDMYLVIASHITSAGDLALAAQINQYYAKGVDKALLEKALAISQNKANNKEALKLLKSIYSLMDNFFEVIFKSFTHYDFQSGTRKFMINHQLVSREMIVPGKRWGHFDYEKVLDKFASLSEDEIFKFMEATESTIWDASASYAFLCKINPEKLTRLAKRICEKLNFHLQGIALLVQCGMDPNLQITFKGQPMSLLHRLLAPEYENPNYLNSRNPLATTLLEYGAHPENLLPHVLKRHKQDANLNLIVAFIKAGANRNPPDLAEPLLSYAPYPDVTLLLLQNGFPVDARDEQGRTALMRAVQLKDTTQVRLLLEAGANPKLVDIQQRNFLHYLAHSNDNNPIQMIQFLTAECNLDLDEAFEQRNVDGKTPIEQLVGHIDDKTVRDFVINYYQRRSEKLQEQAEQLKIQADRLVRLQQDVDYFKSLATDQAKDQKPHISG